MKKRYVCIHGHFYQPPRENAWLERVEMHESAFPDHDWNARITRECYATNAKARLLNAEGRIERTVNNYARISFNFGPTLLAWMQSAAPGPYRQIIASDRESAQRLEGCGSALAQAYNHAILPLCNERDRRTQVAWGMRDFQCRFGRRPAGMWLPETAANVASLEALAEQGIEFTILAPRQCAAVRPIGDGAWDEIGERVDPTRAYLCRLPSGRSLSVFFYDGPVAQAVAFEGLLNSGDRYAERLLGGFDDRREHHQLMHIATDGESYGHHHPHGEMALAAALAAIAREPSVELINYELYLRRHPPEFEARIHENSSWSCVHGVERWRSDCGCNSGRSGLHQGWRGPLRAALDWLRDSVAPPFEDLGRRLFRDPWTARDGYIDVILDRAPQSRERFLSAHAARPLDDRETITALRLMELQRHAMLMYTSCAWFFDDVADIGTVQVIQYAARVIELARSALSLELEAEFLDRIAQAPGNNKEYPDGRAVYERSVRPAIVSLPRVAAHYAIHRLFDGDLGRIYSYQVDDAGKRLTSGKARMVVGHANFRSELDFEAAHLSYCALHLGDHVVSCGVRTFIGPDAFATVQGAAAAAFDRADFAEVLRLMDREFGGTSYSIASLFRDEQYTVVRRILEPALAQIDASYRQIYEQNAPLARFLNSMGLTVPRRIQLVGSFVLSQEFRRTLERPAPDLARAAEVVEEASRSGVALDEHVVGKAVTDAMARAIADAAADAPVARTCKPLLALVRFIGTLPVAVDIWPLQEHFLEHIRPQLDALRGCDAPESAAGAAAITELGVALGVQV